MNCGADLSRWMPKAVAPPIMQVAQTQGPSIAAAPMVAEDEPTLNLISVIISASWAYRRAST
jgi:hypothetical protein